MKLPVPSTEAKATANDTGREAWEGGGARVVLDPPPARFFARYTKPIRPRSGGSSVLGWRCRGGSRAV